MSQQKEILLVNLRLLYLNEQRHVLLTRISYVSKETLLLNTHLLCLFQRRR
jgi:hypothetical protein